MKIAILTFVAATIISFGQQSSPAQYEIPKDFRAVHEKHGCALAVPREWPVSGSNWLSPKDMREIDVIVRVMPRTGPVADVKKRISKTRETVVEENESRIWLQKGMTSNSALDYSIRQDLPKTGMTCSVHISIQHPSDLPKYADIAKRIAQSVHAE